ncbi:MAG TPA: MMPL family transporter [Acidimicrobiales bacterium]|nr:MMPL family transporter [Acidimicrobiales bacterium]
MDDPEATTPGQRRWDRLAATFTHRPGVVLAVLGVVTLLLAAGTTKLTFATGQDSYLNASSRVAVDNRAYQSLFGGQAMITVFSAEPGHTILDLFSSANRAELTALQAKLDRTPGVHSAATPLTAMDWNQALVAPTKGNDPTSSVAGQILLRTADRETVPARKKARLDDAAATLARFNAAGARTYDNPAWVRFLLVDNQGNIREALRPFFPTPPGVAPTLANTTHAQMIVRLNGNQTTQQEGKATVAVTKAVRAVHFDGFTTLTTGAPALLKRINDYLMGGMLALGAIALVVMVVILSTVFRVRWRLVPLVVMIVGVVWTFGLLGYLGFQLSVVTIAGLPIMIGLGVEFAIQVHNRTEEEIAAGSRPTPFASTLRHIGPALLVATIAAVLACLALKASLTPMIRDFGVLLAVGIAIVFLAALVAPTALLALRERRSPTTRERRQRVVESVMTKLGHLPQAAVPVLMVAAVLLLVGGLFAEEHTPIQTDPNKWVDQSSQVIHDINSMQAKTGASSELGVFVRDPRGVFTDEMGAFVTTFALTELQRYPVKLSTVSSLPTVVYYLMEVPGASKLPPTGTDLRAAYDVAPVDLQRSLVAANDTAVNVVFQTGPSTLAVRKEVTVNIRNTVVPPAGISATPSGLAVIGVGLLDNLTSNRLLLTYLALGAVFLWLLIRFRNLLEAVVMMLPIVLAVGLAATIVKLTGITVSPLTTVSSPLVIAICGEFASLIMFRHLEERARGLAPREATDVAAARTGRAFFASSLTTVGGFAVLLFSPLPLLRDFGAIVAITIAIALLSAMTVLPPVLVWFDERGYLRPQRMSTPAQDAPDGPDSPDDGAEVIQTSSA